MGDMTLSAPIVGPHGQPLGAVHVVAPTSRWTMTDQSSPGRLGQPY